MHRIVLLNNQGNRVIISADMVVATTVEGSDTVILLAGGATIRTPTLDSVIWAAVDEATDEPATVRDLR